MGKQEDLAEDIMRALKKRATDTLFRIETEMTLMKWPKEFRRIMYEAIAYEALRRIDSKKSDG